MASSIGQLPPDCIVHIFSHFELTDLCGLASVCQKWFLCHSSDVFWIPLRDELKLPKDQLPVKQYVMEWLKRFQPVEKVVKPLMDGEERFQLVLNGSLISLIRFQNLSAFNQLVCFCKGVNENATCLLKLLIDKIHNAAYDLLCDPNGRLIVSGDNITKEPGSHQIMALQETQLLFSWTEDPLSPFNGNAIITYLQRSLESANPMLRTIAFRTCTNIEQLRKRLPHFVVNQDL